MVRSRSSNSENAPAPSPRNERFAAPPVRHPRTRLSRTTGSPIAVVSVTVAGRISSTPKRSDPTVTIGNSARAKIAAVFGQPSRIMFQSIGSTAKSDAGPRRLTIYCDNLVKRSAHFEACSRPGRQLRVATSKGCIKSILVKRRFIDRWCYWAETGPESAC
jgi:hypothetical protein